LRQKYDPVYGPDDGYYNRISDDDFVKWCDFLCIDFDEDRWDEGKAFLKENYNISDIDSISDDEYFDLFDELVEIEEDEAWKIRKTGGPTSELGGIVSSIVSYMRDQTLKGGKRYYDDDGDYDEI